MQPTAKDIESENSVKTQVWTISKKSGSQQSDTVLKGEACNFTYSKSGIDIQPILHFFQIEKPDVLIAIHIEYTLAGHNETKALNYNLTTAKSTAEANN